MTPEPLDEASRRVPDFKPSAAVRLFDGDVWFLGYPEVVPDPVETARFSFGDSFGEAAGEVDARFNALAARVSETADLAPDEYLAETVLPMARLQLLRNYYLDDHELDALLIGPRGDFTPQQIKVSAATVLALTLLAVNSVLSLMSQSLQDIVGPMANPLSLPAPSTN